MQYFAKLIGISIHAPRTGSDGCIGADGRQPDISIHAPRTGSDGNGRRAILLWRISIHAPRTGSDIALSTASRVQLTFQSTLPARGATKRLVICQQAMCISIHAPRTGSDERLMCAPIYCETFQSTLPARGATMRGDRRRRPRHQISIHAPRTGSDPPIPFCCPHPGDYFNPRSPHGERRCSALRRRAWQ